MQPPSLYVQVQPALVKELEKPDIRRLIIELFADKFRYKS